MNCPRDQSQENPGTTSASLLPEDRYKRERRLASQRRRTALSRQFKRWKLANPWAEALSSAELAAVRERMKVETFATRLKEQHCVTQRYAGIRSISRTQFNLEMNSLRNFNNHR